MHCKFLSHGIALAYDNILKPCCEWRIDPTWRANNHRSKVDLSSWHQQQALVNYRDLLARDQWPDPCVSCKKLEQVGRGDSMRLSGNRSYANHSDDDITLEIRPGSTCNFACQTCWPEASSRVAQYQIKAGIIDQLHVDSHRFDDFDFLDPIRDRIKNVVLLGGEPFYDKSCLSFLRYAHENLRSDITMFTNGSCVDFDFLESFQGKFILVFSLDAVGKAAEYIRYGTVWNQVLDNFQRVRTLSNVETRVNITMSVYNLLYAKDLISMLCEDWPEVVTFGHPRESKLQEQVIPIETRQIVIDSLNETLKIIVKAQIESNQKHNAINAISDSLKRLKDQPWNHNDHHQLIDFISRMDRVKNISIEDYCPELSRILFI
jgi:wyosine [tRNA(Phe)-imidazoG37] synthetase (radical SAM superfamily)